MEKRLAAQYGKYKRFDWLPSGSIWKEPEDFMMGLLKKDRILNTYWTKKEGSTLKDDLSEIGLQTFALSQDKGFLVLRYSFNNFSECKKENENDQDKAF